MENNNETNKTETPTITDEDVINYITQQKEASKEKYKVTEIDENTKSIQLDKEVAKDFIDTVKFNKGDIAAILKDEQDAESQSINRVKVEQDAAFNFSALYSEKLKKQLDKVIITDAEKDKYITCILSEQPIFLDVTYAKLQDISFTFRSKFVYEQEYIAKFIKEMLLSEKGKSMTPDEMCIFIFKTNVAIILHQVNSVDFFDKKLPINLTDIISYGEFTDIISARIDQLSKLGQQFWSLIVNAACVFEKKEQLLAEFFVNEDF